MKYVGCSSPCWTIGGRGPGEVYGREGGPGPGWLLVSGTTHRKGPKWSFPLTAHFKPESVGSKAAEPPVVAPPVALAPVVRKGPRARVGRSVVAERRSSVPGPGAYEVPGMCHTKDPQCFSFGERGPSFIVPSKAPGPGTYNEVPGPRVRGGSLSLSSRQISRLVPIDCPAMLNVCGDFATSSVPHKFSTASKLSRPNGGGVPGPGAYSTIDPKFFQTMGRCVRVGKAPARGKMNEADEEKKGGKAEIKEARPTKGNEESKENSFIVLENLTKNSFKGFRTRGGCIAPPQNYYSLLKESRGEGVASESYIDLTGTQKVRGGHWGQERRGKSRPSEVPGPGTYDMAASMRFLSRTNFCFSLGKRREGKALGPSTEMNLDPKFRLVEKSAKNCVFPRAPRLPDPLPVTRHASKPQYLVSIPRDSLPVPITFPKAKRFPTPEPDDLGPTTYNIKSTVPQPQPWLAKQMQLGFAAFNL